MALRPNPPTAQTASSGLLIGCSYPSFTQPPTPRLALFFSVPPPCPSVPLDFLALALVHFVLALPFEVSTAFILAPSLAIRHLSSRLLVPSTPFGPVPPVPPPRPLLRHLFLAFVLASLALAPPLEGTVQDHKTPHWPTVAIILSSSPLRHRCVVPHWPFTVSIIASQRLRNQGISWFLGLSAPRCSHHL